MLKPSQCDLYKVMMHSQIFYQIVEKFTEICQGAFEYSSDEIIANKRKLLQNPLHIDDC